MNYIRSAQSDEVDELNRIAFESEAYWGYDSDFMERFKANYKITAEFIKTNPTFLLSEEGRIIGFYSLIVEENEVEFFYIKPQYIGKGYGKIMWNSLLDYSRSIGIRAITLVTSPQAKAFYEKMGAVQIGEVESILKEGRKIPRLKYEF